MKHEKKQHSFIVRKILRYYNYHTRGVQATIIIVVGVSIMLGIFSFLERANKRLDKVNTISATVAEIPTLVGNIRTLYTMEDLNGINIIDRLRDRGAIPQSMLSGNSVQNLYGGQIVALQSDPLLDEQGNVKFNTFKISYQGLPYEACLEIAKLDWGDDKNGLLAVAIGSVNKDGYDNALYDVDHEKEDGKLVERTDKNGKRKMVRQRAKYRFNVAKPGNSFMPTPFSKNNAESGCSCRDKGNTCSFALRYSAVKSEE